MPYVNWSDGFMSPQHVFDEGDLVPDLATASWSSCCTATSLDCPARGTWSPFDREGRVRRICLPPSPDARPPISELAAVIDGMRP